ncbi:MAG: fibronectin type III domain-containing protein [Bifidobacteriaceae bacterium]|jgi:hypothetical protein|nr:fibronectin type III domain-containing protein [Bifidobacteriaceae bacterium]
MTPPRSAVRWAKAAAWIALPAVVIALAVTRPGFPVDAVEMTDSSVWVVNLADSQRKAARYNQPIEELTGGFTISQAEGRFDVVQAAADVAITQAQNFRVVDPRALRLAEPTAYPQAEAEPPPFSRVGVGGGAALVVNADATEAWVRPFEAIGGLDAEADKPDFDLDRGRAVVAPDGTVFAVTQKGEIKRANVGEGPKTKVQDLGSTEAPSSQVTAVTAVGARAYALAGTTLHWQGGSVDLGQYGDADSLALQSPGAASNYVGVAGPGALLLIDKKGRVTELATGNEGQPAVPATVGACVHAAWAADGEDGDNYIASCDGAKTASRALEKVTSSSDLVFRVNRKVIVLNDVSDGRVWMPTMDAKVRDALNWDQIDPQNQQDSLQEDNTDADRQLDCEDKTAKPKAEDDEVGVRPGASAVLMVLSNDTATSCGALGIERVDDLDESEGTAEPILAGRAIQFKPAPGVKSANFIYTISDANGQTSSATVSVDVVETANQPPDAPKAELRLDVELGASATYNALTGFTDPEGDPMQLASAVSDDPSVLLTYRPGGNLTVKDNGGGARSGIRVMLTVQDALGAAAAPTPLTVAFHDPGSLTPKADPAKATTFIDQAVTVDLRESLRTSHLEPPVFTLDGEPDALASLKIDADTGQATFTASAANSYLLALTITAGGNTGHMSLRVDVEDVTTPRVVAVQDVAYLRPGAPSVVDPLLNDVAESGGVKVLGSYDTSAAPGVEAVPVGHQYLELSDTGGTGAEVVKYTVSVDGVTDEGRILVVHADAGANQDPVVSPKRLKVRAGGVVTIPVLDQTFDPDGDAIQIDTTVAPQPTPGCGKVYASGKTVRFQAPEDGCKTPVTVPVQVLDDAGGAGLGSFTVEVHESQGGSKPPPEPRDLTARVLQGEEVRIPVPLSGIDVDGDGVSLLQGLDTQPLNGSISEIGPDYITYKAGQDQAPGTDKFTYAVEDWASNRATASVEVGVSAKAASAVGVVARDDSATAKPLKVLDIPVFANDVDLSGADGLTFCEDQVLGLSDPSLAAQPDSDGLRLSVTMPQQPGDYQVVYYACGPSGNRDSASVNLTVDPDAPVAPPKAKDIVSPPQETIDKESIDIDVMRWAYNPSGPTSDLELFLPDESLAHAALRSDQEITVRLQQDLPTIVFYGVRNTAEEAAGATAYGSVTVPPISRPPYLRPDLDPIKAEAGIEEIIDLDEFVAVTKGRAGAFLFEPDASGNLSAGHGAVASADGGGSISYTADPKHQGADRIEFWVADGAEADDKSLKKSRLWLDVIVGAKGQVALSFADPAPQVEQGGGARTLDLADFTAGDGKPLKDPGRLAADVGKSPLAGVKVNTSETKVVIEADTTAQVGQLGAIPLTLAYDGGEPKAGLAITVSVVETKQPAVKPKSLAPVKVKVGQPETVPVLQGVFDPWIDSHPAQLKNVRVSGEGAWAEASGQSIVVSATETGSQPVVSFEVEDGVGRRQSGSFQAVPIDTPERPASVTPTPGDKGSVSVTWSSVVGLAARGEPVKNYTVAIPGAAQADCLSPVTENRTTCAMGQTPYGGKFTVEVRAVNAVGEGEAGTGELNYQIAPEAPSNLKAEAGYKKIQLSWTPPPADGGTVTGYSVTCGEGVEPMTAPAAATSLTVADLAAMRARTCSIQAIGAEAHRSNTVDFPSATPWGDPGQPGTPKVSWRSDNSVALSWDASDDAGAGVEYKVEKNNQTTACPQQAVTSCVVAVAPGETFKFQVHTVPLKPGAKSVASAWTVAYAQPPTGAPALAALTARVSLDAKAGQGWIEIENWPDIRTSYDGVPASVAYTYPGGSSSTKPSSSFIGLHGGSYSFRASYSVLLPPSAAEWTPGHNAVLGGDTGPLDQAVTTKPSAPGAGGGANLCRVSRSDETTLGVTGCAVADWGAAGDRALQYRLNSSDPWVSASGVGGSFPVAAGDGAGSIEIRALNSVGASDVVGPLGYDAWQPEPPVSPSPSPSAAARPGSWPLPMAIRLDLVVGWQVFDWPGGPG